MTGGRDEISRVLVALDASPESLAALTEAARLAARLGVDLHGIFVEDINLINLAALPVAREVQVISGSGGRPQRTEIESQVRAQAVMARRAIEAAARERNLRWSFEIARGRVELELMRAALESDLMAMGKAIRPLTRRARLGSTARSLASAAHCGLLLTAEGALSAPHRVGVVYDGSPCGERALALASRLARNDAGMVVVYLLPPPGADAAEMQAHAVGHLDPVLDAEFRTLSRPMDAADAARADGRGFMVLAASAFAPEELQSLIEQLDCPALVCRR